MWKQKQFFLFKLFSHYIWRIHQCYLFKTLQLMTKVSFVSKFSFIIKLVIKGFFVRKKEYDDLESKSRTKFERILSFNLFSHFYK